MKTECSQLTSIESRTKAGTPWNKLQGLEKLTINNKLDLIKKNWKRYRNKMELKKNY